MKIIVFKTLLKDLYFCCTFSGMRFSALPSFMPFRMLPYTDHMTFVERLHNTYTQLSKSFWSNLAETNQTLLHKYRKIGDDLTSFDELDRRYETMFH